MLAQWSGRAPGGGIVNIDVGHKPSLQAIHQAVIHYVIHSAVAAHLARQLSGLLPEGMLVLLPKCVDSFPVFFFRTILRTIGLLFAVQENRGG